MPIEEEKVTGALSAADSVEMLKAIIDGETYQRVVNRFGVSRTAVERRIKKLMRQLAENVGVEGLSAEQAVYVHHLREHRDAILIALSQFVPSKPLGPRADPRLVSDAEQAHALKRIGARSNFPHRDQALLCILFVTGARPLEVARLEVRDYLNADGSVRTESELRAEVSITGKARPLFFMNARLNDLLSPYLEGRRVQSQGVAAPNAYRGLDPNSRLFVSPDGEGFKIFQYGKEGRIRSLCQPILELYRKLFKQSELHGISPLTVRQTVAARLYERGADEEQVGLLLGVRDKNAVKKQFPRLKRSLHELFRN